MNRRFFTSIKTCIIYFFFSLFITGCGDEYITEVIEITEIVDPEGEFGYVYTEIIKIKASDWKWNKNSERFEASVSISDLRENEYNYGALVGNVFIEEDDTEKLYTLPYVRTWVDDNSGELFTETISCALSYDTKRIYFYIQSSDLFEDDLAPWDYEFKVSIIYNFTY